MSTPKIPLPDVKFLRRRRAQEGYCLEEQEPCWCCFLGARLTPKWYKTFNGDDPIALIGRLESKYPTLESMAADGMPYAPPQLRHDKWPKLKGPVNWYSHRSPFCGECFIPACVCYLKCCFGFKELSLLESPDEVFVEMLSRGVAPHLCPERLKGLYWMQDNLANEVLLTLQDTYWTTPTSDAVSLQGMKDMATNFSRDPTFFGCWNGPPFSPVTCPPIGCCPCCCPPCCMPVYATRTPMSFIASAAMKWLHAGPGTFVYIPGSDEVLRDADGNEVPFDSSQDLLRISGDPEGKAPDYQYRCRRIAYLAPDGSLVRTPAWEELIAKVRAENPTPGSCGGRLYTNLTIEQRLQNTLDYLNDRQIYRLPPTPLATQAINRC